MVVKINYIDALSNLGDSITEYSNNVSEATQGVQKDFNLKFENSKAAAVESYVNVMMELQTTIFVEYPIHMKKFSKALKGYHNDLNGLPFRSIIISNGDAVASYVSDLKGKQFTTISDAAVDIKKAIDDAATLVEEIETSKIESEYLSTLTTDLTDDANRVQEIHDRAEEAKRAFMEKLQQILSDLKSDKNKIDQIMTITDPKKGLKVKQVLEYIKDGSLDEKNLGSLLGNMTKTDDVKAFKALLKGDYEAFFKIDSDNMSDGMYQLVLQNVINMVCDEDEAGLKKVLDALLNCGSDKNRNKHLDRLSLNSDYMALQSIDLYLQVEAGLTEDERTAFEKVITSIQNISTLFLGFKAMNLKGDRHRYNGPDGYWSESTFSISKLSINIDGSIDMTINEQITDETGKTTNKDPKEMVLSTSENSQEKMTDDLRKRMQELKKEQREMFEKFWINMGATIGGIINPGLKGGISLLTSIPSISNMLQSGLDMSQNKNASSAYKMSSNIFNLYNNYMDNLNKLDATNRELLEIMINSGGQKVEIDGEIVVVQGGMPTIESTKNLNEITNNGFKNYVAQAQIEAQKSHKKTDLYKLFGDPLTPEEDFVLNGNGDINEMNFDKINNILEKINKNSGLSVGNWLKQGLVEGYEIKESGG